MKKSAGFAISILVTVGLGIFLAACRDPAPGRDPVERINANTLKVNGDALENLKLATASVMAFPDQLPVMGKISITEDRTNAVPARVAGRIDHIFFASGETVTRGKPLATMFSPDFVAAKEEYLQAARQSAGASPGSKADPSDFANLARMARKKLEVMGLSKQDIDALREGGPDNASELLIRAPRNGVIIAKSAVTGNLVNVGDTLFTIGDLSKVWFLGDLYPEDLPKVRKDQQVRIVAGGAPKPLTGNVSFISPIVDTNSRTIKIRALIDNSAGLLRGDEYVQGNLILDDAKALLVPTPAVIHTPDGDAVYKRVSPATMEGHPGSVSFQKVVVKLGAERQGMTAVLDGLKDNDEVVSDGGLLLDAALNSSEKAK